MTADRLLHGVLLSGSGIEDHLAVLHKVELTVGREAVLLRQVIPAGREHLRICMGTEASAAHTVDCTLRCALKRMVESDTVTDQKIRIVVRARCRGRKITDELAALIELAAPFAGVVNDWRSRQREIFSIRIGNIGDTSVFFFIYAKSSVLLCKKQGLLLFRACAYISADGLICKKSGTYRSSKRKTRDSENDTAI